MGKGSGDKKGMDIFGNDLANDLKKEIVQNHKKVNENSNHLLQMPNINEEDSAKGVGIPRSLHGSRRENSRTVSQRVIAFEQK